MRYELLPDCVCRYLTTQKSFRITWKFPLRSLGHHLRFVLCFLSDTVKQIQTLLKLIWIQALHFNYFIVATSIVERVTSFRKIVQYVTLVEYGNPRTVVPLDTESIF